MSSPPSLKDGFSSPDLDKGVGVYTNGCIVESRVQPSSSGGISLERVVIEDDVSSDDERGLFPGEEEAITRNTTNTAVRLAFCNNPDKKGILNLNIME